MEDAWHVGKRGSGRIAARGKTVAEERNTLENRNGRSATRWKTVNKENVARWKPWRKKRNTLENRAYDKLSAGKITNEKNIQKYYERTRHDEFPHGHSHP